MSGYTVTLSGPAPWGFRLQGGKDFNMPLTISRITPGSKAAGGSLSQGDVISAIDGVTTDGMTHLEGQNKIKSATSTLNLSMLKSRRAAAFPTSAPSRMDSPLPVIPHQKEVEQDIIKEDEATADEPEMEEPVSSGIRLARRPSVKYLFQEPAKKQPEPEAVSLPQPPPRPEAVSPPQPPPRPEAVSLPQPPPRPSPIPVKPPAAAVSLPQPPPRPSPIPVKPPAAIVAPASPQSPASAQPGPPRAGQYNTPIGQYNTPIGLYSAETRREMAAMQAKLGEAGSGRLSLPGLEYTPNFNPTALKDSALSTHKPIEVRGPGGKATIVHAQYNTPISMYSQDAIMDAIAGQSQAKGHDGGSLPMKEPVVDCASPVYQAVIMPGDRSEQMAEWARRAANLQSKSFRMLAHLTGTEYMQDPDEEALQRSRDKFESEVKGPRFAKLKNWHQGLSSQILNIQE